MTRRTFTIALILTLTAAAAAQQPVYDVVVYGPTSGGVAAAVQAARMGKSVVLVGPDKHLGGLTASGLGWTDSGDKAVIGGISRQFYQRVKKHYDQPDAWTFQKPQQYSRYRAGDDAMWVFEPHVAELVYEQMIAEAKVPVYRDHWLDRSGKGVKKDGPRIVSITMRNGATFRGRTFIDASYEGDLMAAAGVAYTVGREPNSKYGETLNGVQTRHAVSHQFDAKVDPYVKAGDPSSGLLPRIHDGGPGKDGAGDHRIQAYNYRVCLTRVPENRVPFPKPPSYDPLQYELLLRYLKTGSKHVFGKFDPAPNNKTDTNNHGAFSTDDIGMNYDYPEASYERRRQILDEHRRYQQGYHYFLANDPRVPANVRQSYAQWGLARDEFLDNDHWPHQIYVREARRMVSDFVMTELHLRKIKPTPEPIGMGSYNMDSHNTQRYVAFDKDGKAYARNEGDVEVSPGGPYPVSYRAIVPRQDECTNLLVPVCVSSSHIAYGSIRMEPVFMVLGQSAATAACNALDDGVAVQQVDYAKLRARLLADGQVLEHAGSAAGAKGIDPKTLAGVVIDDAMADLAGAWVSSASVPGFIGTRYVHDNNEAKGAKTARFTTKIARAGRYNVRLAYTANPNRATNVPVTIHSADGDKTVTVNQRQSPKVDRAFVSLGTFRFNAGDDAVVEVSNKGTDGFVIVDAVQFVEVK